MTVKQFLNFCMCLQFNAAKQVPRGNIYLPGSGGQIPITHKTSVNDLYMGMYAKNPRLYCADGVSISIQNHRNAHSEFNGIETDSLGYSKGCNIEPLYAETDCEYLNQFCSDSIEDIEAYVTKHGGIDLDKTIEYMWKYLNR